MDTNKIGIVILAAGDGKRMQSTTPKVMTPLLGMPLVEHVVKKTEALSREKKIVVVVNPKHTLVQDHLGERAQYVVQNEQLGTGHATAFAESILKDSVEHVVVLYGDMPSITTRSLEQVIEEHRTNENTLTLMTATVPDFEGWREVFYKNFSRVIRSEDGNILRTVEFRDATEEERTVTELNPCFYCFRADWLWKNLKSLKNDNVQKEYYLTDLLKMALETGEKVSAVSIEPREILGINSKEDLEIVSKFLEK